MEFLSHPLFRRVTHLTVDLDDKCPFNVCHSLSNLIDLTLLTQLTLNLNFDFTSNMNTREYLTNIFKQTSNIHTIEINNNLSILNSHVTIEDICQLIPLYIKHLQVTVKNLNDMKIIFDRCQFLSSLTFRFTSQKSIPSTKLIESFLNIKKDLTYRKDDSTIRVWLNQFNISK